MSALKDAPTGARVTRAGVIGSVLVVVVAITCVRLGLWQLDRLAQRRALNAVAAERMDQPPVDIADVPPDSSAAYRPVRLAGGCEGEQIVLAARSRRGSPGVHLLCRFHSASGPVVLLDRGWLPSADARSIDDEAYAQAPRDTTLDALVVPFPPGVASDRPRTTERVLEPTGDGGVRAGAAEPRVIYRLNRAQAIEATGLDLPVWYVRAIGPDDVLPIPAGPPDLSEGPHLGYAVQWFSFAAIALIGWLVLMLRRRDASQPVPGSTGATARSWDEPQPGS